MPRRGENIYKRKDGRWEGRKIKENGKYQYFYAKTYREVKEKMKNYQESEVVLKVKSESSASQMFEFWLSSEELKYVKPSTYENYYCCMHNYVIPFFKKKGNEKITDVSVDRFTKEIKENIFIAESYKKKILSIFKTALKEILKKSPNRSDLLEIVKLPKTQEKEVQVFTMREQKMIENYILASKDSKTLGIILCFYTGIRLGELCGLKWGDFDLEAGVISILRTISRTRDFSESDKKTRLSEGTPKSKNSIRKIPIPIFLQHMCTEIDSTYVDDNFYLLSGGKIPMDPRTYQSFFKKVLAGAGVKERKFHAIRHTFATRALELGVDIKTLSEILGHSSVSITLNVYAHSLLEQKKIAIEKFNDMHITHMNESFLAKTSVNI